MRYGNVSLATATDNDLIVFGVSPFAAASADNTESLFLTGFLRIASASSASRTTSNLLSLKKRREKEEVSLDLHHD